MPRLHKNIPAIRRHRKNKGLLHENIVEEAKISTASISRIERGFPVSRVIAARYLRLLEIDLDHPHTWPPDVEIIAEGDEVIISSKQ